MSEIKRGDIVKILSTGKYAIINDFQQVHNRYQLRGVSGWQHDVSNVEKISDDLISVLNAPSNQGEATRLREALVEIANYDVDCRQGHVDEWTEAVSFTECQKIAREALSSTEDTGPSISSMGLMLKPEDTGIQKDVSDMTHNDKFQLKCLVKEYGADAIIGMIKCIPGITEER